MKTIKENIKEKQQAIGAIDTCIAGVEKELETVNESIRSLFNNHMRELAYERKNGAGEYAAQLKNLRKARDEKEAKKARMEDLRKIEQHNLRALCEKAISDLLPAIVAKYEGKQAGPKTLEKIKNEFEEKSGFCVLFKRCFMECSVDSVDYWGEGLRAKQYMCSEEIGSNNRGLIIDQNNTIKGGWEIRPFVQAIENPSEKLEEIYKARSKYQKAKKAMEEAYKEFREVAVDGFSAD